MSRVTLVCAAAALVCLVCPRCWGQTTSRQLSDDVSCGRNCLFVALAAVELPVESSAEIERILGPPSSIGYSVAQLSTAASELGAECRAVKTSFRNLAARTESFACIALLDDGHFVLIQDVSPGGVSVIDPLRAYETTQGALKSTWDGTALLISRNSIESEEALAGRLWRTQILRQVGVFGGMILLAGVTIVLVRAVFQQRASQDD